MATKPITERVRIEGNNLIVEDCDGNKTITPIPCTCNSDVGGADTDDGRAYPVSGRCRLSVALANNIMALLAKIKEMLDDGLGSLPLDLATQWVQYFHLPAIYVIPMSQYVAEYGATIQTITFDNSLDEFLELENAINCAVFTGIALSGGLINNVWKSKVEQLLFEEPAIARCSASGFLAIAAFVHLVPSSQWQEWGLSLSGDIEIGAGGRLTWGFSIGCDDCDDNSGDCSSYDESTSFKLTGIENDWIPFEGDLGDLPGEHWNDIGDGVTYTFTSERKGRGYEIPTKILPGAPARQIAAIQKHFDTPIPVCSIQSVCKIFFAEPETIDNYTGNSSVMGIWAKQVGDTDYSLIGEGIVGINYPNLRYALFEQDVPMDNVTDIVLAHRGGGGYPAIIGVFINVALVLGV